MSVGLRRTIGITLIAVGFVVGIALWFAAAARYDNAVADLAPAPIGCNTTLRFDEIGTYTFFVETTGHVGAIDGDCASDSRTYDERGVPRVTLTLSDPDGGNVDLERTDGPSYDRDGSAGHGIRTASIDDPGAYVLSVSASGSTDAVIRVGRDPAAGVAALRLGAVVTMLAGALGGTVILAMAARRPRPVVVERIPPPQQPTGLPTRPPLGPPTRNPTIPPPYAPVPTYQPPPPAATPGGSTGWAGPTGGAPTRPSTPRVPPGGPPASAWPPPRAD